VLGGHLALRPEAGHILAHPQSLVRSSLYFLQLHRLAYILGVEHDWTQRASPLKRLPVLRCSYQRSLQRERESLVRPWVTGATEEAATERAHGVRQCRVMELVALLRVLDVVVMDEAATVEFLRSALLCSDSSKSGTPTRRNAGRIKGVLPVEHADDLPVRVG